MARVQKNAEGQYGDPSGPSDAENGSLPKKEDGQNLDFAQIIHPERDQWSNKIDFILSCIGFAVGLGNVWRFPYLCYKNGGGAFLIPYFLCLVCGGVPVFFLEVALGQFMSQGGLGVWKICPIFQGIGVATTVIVFLLNIYYIVILAWDLYYMGMAFNSVLPWAHCNNSWNTWKCSTSFGPKTTTNLTMGAALNASMVSSSSLSGGSLTANLTVAAAKSYTPIESITTWGFNANMTAAARNFTPVDPVVEFWERKILQISDGVDDVGGIVWELALALFIVWVLCYFCIWKGVKWTGKVVYFTATFPYVVLTVLLIRGVTLPGSHDGLVFYLRPDFSRLADAQVWIDAGTQIFFSYAIALGAMTALGSYNKFQNDCYRDCIVIAGVNSFTSLYAGFVIFSVLGFMAHEQGVGIDEVAESGPGLAFIAYPKAVTQMPVAPLWAVLFFMMIVLLGLDSQFVGMEAFITVIVDLFPVLRRGWNKEIFVAIYSIISFLIGLTMVTNGGMYVFQLFDYYSASGMALLWVCFFECITVAWVYGGRRFYDNLEQMIGYRINPWLRICWTYITPLIIVSIFIFMWVGFKPLTYNRGYEYPAWAQAIGMSMAFASMLCIPAYFVIKLLITPGSLKQRWRRLTTPELHPHQIPEHWDNALKLAAQQLISARQPCVTRRLHSHDARPFITHSNGHTDIVYKVAPPHGYDKPEVFVPLDENKVPLVD